MGLAVAVPAESVAQTDPFVGTFSNADLTIVLSVANGRYTGRATVDGQTFTIAAEPISESAILRDL